MILYLNDDGTEEITTEYDNNDNETDTATETDALLLHVSQSELDTAVETLPKIYDLFCFWFLVWLSLEMLKRIRLQFRKHTGEMRDKNE